MIADMVPLKIRTDIVLKKWHCDPKVGHPDEIVTTGDGKPVIITYYDRNGRILNQLVLPEGSDVP